VYCPDCGTKNPRKAKFCKVCGIKFREDYLEFVYGQRYLLYVLYLSFALIIGSIIACIVFQNNSFLWLTFLGFMLFIGLVVYGVYDSRTHKKKNKYKKYYGECPHYEMGVPSTNFCIKCGHDLKDIIGYFKRDASEFGIFLMTAADIEITSHGLIIYKATTVLKKVVSFDITKIVSP
jgi:hypothetical protein